jgi:hypothetical protein
MACPATAARICHIVFRENVDGLSASNFEAFPYRKYMGIVSDTKSVLWQSFENAFFQRIHHTLYPLLMMIQPAKYPVCSLLHQTSLYRIIINVLAHYHNIIVSPHYP